MEVKVLRFSVFGSLMSSEIWITVKMLISVLWGGAVYIEYVVFYNGSVRRGGVVANKCLRYR